MIDKQQAEAAMSYVSRKCKDDAEMIGQALGLVPYEAIVSRRNVAPTVRTRTPEVMENARSINFARGKIV